MNTFEARFDSECPGCGGDIEEGDEIAYIDNEIACPHCIQMANGT